MLFPRINREKAEKGFATFRNVAGATIEIGYPAVWAISSPDGNRVSKPATATLSLFVGIAVEQILDTDYGKFQVYGYTTQANSINNETTATAAGNILIPVDAQWYLKRSGASDGLSGFVYAGEAFATATTPAAANKKAFIRAL